MSATNAFEQKILELWLDNVGAANIGDATGLRGSTSAGNIYVSLHTADPGETGDQTTSETAYTNYARVAVARGTAWTTSGGASENVAAIVFPACGATGSTITHFGLGFAASGAGSRDFNGAAPYTAASGNTPEFAIGALDLTLD